MSASRIRIRLMDRTRRIDDFRTVLVAGDLAKAMVDVHSTAAAIAGGSPGCRCGAAVATAAVNMAHGQMSENGATVGTRLMEDNWLLMVRVDHDSQERTCGGSLAEDMKLAA